MSGVVVGVRGRGMSGASVRWASAAADRYGLHLSLVHAWNEPLELTVDLDPVSLPDLVAPATSRAAQGTPSVVLLAQKPDLLVLGGHSGARHLPRLTRTCLHHADCPVVVVPDTERSSQGRIVVGVCGTDASTAALLWAAGEARLRRADLVVCYAWQVRPTSALDLLVPARAIPSQQHLAEERLSRWVAQILGPQQVELSISHGGPLEALFETAAAADLMVLGRSVHSMLGRVLHGAVGDELSGLAPCPVAVVPGPTFLPHERSADGRPRGATPQGSGPGGPPSSDT